MVLFFTPSTLCLQDKLVLNSLAYNKKRTCLNRRLHLKSTAHAPPQPEETSGS